MPTSSSSDLRVPADQPETPDVSGAYPRLTDEQLMTLSRYGDRRSVPEGTVLFCEGDQDCGFFVVLEGKVAVVQETAAEPRLIAVHGPGRFLGDLALLTGQTVLVTAVAVTNAEVLEVRVERLKDLVAADQALGDLILRAFIFGVARVMQDPLALPDDHRYRGDRDAQGTQQVLGLGILLDDAANEHSNRRRRPPVTDLTTPYPMTAEQVERFDADGFIVLSQALAPDVVRSYEPDITAKVIELNTMHLPLEERSTYQRAFLQVMNLWQHSGRVRELVHSPRLARLAAELLGVEAVRLYHDQALYKEPGGGFTPWHADQYYWPFDSDRTCTIWLPLQDTPLEMGPVSFAAGSHHISLGRDLPISSTSEEQMQRVLAEQDVPVVQQPFRLGDASVHLGWTFHRAAPNTTPEPRRVMTIIYMDAEITVTDPNPVQRSDLETWLPGVAVGAVPDTPLNPVLFSRS